MENTLLTYNDCVAICAVEDSKFYESKFVIDGYNISIFNYRLAMYNDFETPLIDSDVNAFEMRGLTFVFNKDGSVYRRYLLIGKFFNLNQTSITMEDVVKDYDIAEVYNKEDGSLISFIELPNGRVLAKSKTSFESEQALEAQKIYDTDENLRNFVNENLKNDIIPIFEFVSPFNRIVLRYDDTKLILLKLRDNKTGEYLNIDNASVEIAERERLSLNDMIEMSRTLEDKEGWIILFTNGLLMKIKTKWYFEKHRLLTDEIWKENIIIGHILNETIDDVLSQIDKEELELRAFIENIVKITNHVVNVIMREINIEYGKYKNLSKKEYALSHNKDKYFPFVISMIDHKYDLYEMVKMSVLKQTNKLEKAREWLNTVK